MFQRLVIRTGTVIGLLTVIQLLRWGTTAPWRAARTATATFDDLIGLAATLVGWAVVGWTVAAFVLTAGARVPGTVGRLAATVAARAVPAAARNAAALGLALAAGPVGAAPAAAVDAWPEISSHTMPGVGRPALRQATPAQQPAPAEVTTPPPASTVVVEPGDCLWRIAARALGPSPTNAEIAAAWPRWYAANRTVIGDDPDLILPGMVLHPPATD
ncbi:MAG: hypothetical protein ICV70_07075 [Jiangellaceae bacterium]|nr:hypothetical protein [Jiangellaceae bacterium]